MKVAIVGYGTAGQASAILLSAQGHDVTVFEKSPTLGPVGAGFLLQPTGIAVLDRLGLADRAMSLGQRIDELHRLNRERIALYDREPFVCVDQRGLRDRR